MDTKAIVLKRYAHDFPVDRDITLTTYPIGLLSEGTVLIRLLYLSIDPYIRNRLRPEGTLYIPALALEQPIVSLGIAEIIESQSNLFKPGDKIIGMLAWQEYAIIPENSVRLVHETPLPLTAHLGILGYTGLTAYVGIYHLANLQQGQSVFISSAAGAVGSLAGQLAKLKNCFVIGSTSTDEKVDYLANDLHFDAAFNYSRYTDYAAVIKQYCPQGVDVDFENVGGSMLEAVINCLNPFSTIILCGAISQYNSDSPKRGPRNFYQLIAKQAKLIGYIVTEYEDLLTECQQFIIEQYKAGKISYRETMVNGLENAWSAFQSLFQSKNIGKLIVKV